MAHHPASARINIPRFKLTQASNNQPMYAGQCVISIISCLSRCADLVESLQAEQKKTQTPWSKIWKKPPETPPESTLFSEKAKALCDSIVDSANQLGRALEHRRCVDTNFHSGNFPVGGLRDIRVDLEDKLNKPMDTKLKDGSEVLGSQLDAWKVSLEVLVSRALQDLIYPDPNVDPQRQSSHEAS